MLGWTEPLRSEGHLEAERRRVDERSSVEVGSFRTEPLSRLWLELVGTPLELNMEASCGGPLFCGSC